MNTCVRSAIVIAGLTLSACAWNSQQVTKQVPGATGLAHEYFAAAYSADAANLAYQTEEQYFTWITRFYEGWDLYPFGFQDVVASVLEGSHPDQYPTLQKKLEDLGRRMAAEWAKDKRTPKKVTTAMLSVWGEAIRVAVEADQREEVIDLIAADVTGLVNGKLSRQEIEPPRYVERLGITVASACTEELSALMGAC